MGDMSRDDRQPESPQPRLPEPEFQPPRRLWAVLMVILTLLVCVSILMSSWEQIAALF